MIYLRSVNKPEETHTIQEFIQCASKSDYLGYADLSYMEKRDNIEYIVKNILDEYMDELNDLASEIKLSDWAVREYQYNPKKLSHKLYKTTRLWHMILRINGMGNVHDFDLENHKIKLLEPKDMTNFMSKVYNAERFSLLAYNGAHENDVTPKSVNKYYPLDDFSQRFLYM